MHIKSIILLLASTVLAVSALPHDTPKDKPTKDNKDNAGKEQPKSSTNHTTQWWDHSSSSSTSKSPISPCLLSCIAGYNITATTQVGLLVLAVCNYPETYFASNGGWKKTTDPAQFGFCENKCEDGNKVAEVMGLIRKSELCPKPTPVTSASGAAATGAPEQGDALPPL
ncbi:hypothetical protein DFS34DRAFT_595470 [Phlyctochytrium arcticum]|nr:hypothetical protein DFS34DRAFT_595470 [Phlyctochytrium arcticum]